MSKKKKNKISPLWRDRAKTIGMSPEQIATYTEVEALIAACNRIKPQATTYPPPEKKPATSPKKPEQVKMVFESVISLARSRYTSRASYDEIQINDFLVRNRINPKQIGAIVIRRNMQPDKKQSLITNVRIEYVK